jgi:hypothetical protein
LNEKFAGVMTANHPESPCTDSLIFDRFGSSRAFRAAICAKFFARVDLRVANGVDAKHNAHCAEIFLLKRAQSEQLARQKPLFHRAFLIFSPCARRDVACCSRARLSRVSSARSHRNVSQGGRVHASLSGNTVFFVVLV